MEKQCKGRLAPSPSGRMHLGNALTALLAYLSVKRAGGKLLLRIEDLDSARCRPEYARQLMEDLEWLGIGWDEGPCFQSQRQPAYDAAFRTLAEMGLVYPCYCSRGELLHGPGEATAPHGKPGVYQGTCRNLTQRQREAWAAAGRRCAWRAAVPEERVEIHDGHMGLYSEVLKQDCGDFILRRSDGLYAYQLAVTVDDGEMGVTQVVRGADLLSSTPRQVWLHRMLGRRIPDYYHLPLLTAPDGRRLSKRDGDLDMEALRRRFTARQIVGALAFLAGILDAPEPAAPEELIGGFSWENVPRENIVVKPGFLDGITWR